MDSYGLHTNKSLGQHFLIDDGVVGKILRLADIKAGQSIVEVGPGIGTLTLALLTTGAVVNAVEMDNNLLKILANNAEEFSANSTNLNIISGDALNLNLVKPQFTVDPTALVSNLPYAAAATIVLDYFEHLPQLQTATVMVQKEVAARMSAHPGTKDYGAYTVKLQLLAKPVRSFNVAPSNFFPPPRVESTVIKLQRTKDVMGVAETPALLQHPKPLDPNLNPNLNPNPLDSNSNQPELPSISSFIINAAFAQRRKNIRNSMRSYFADHGQNPDQVDFLLATANIDPTTRGETLSVQEYAQLCRICECKGILLGR
jgi:16S rRNA (adenine1518-N6/adenine1519-N6)-dimethyltransferase